MKGRAAYLNKEQQRKLFLRPGWASDFLHFPLSGNIDLIKTIMLLTSTARLLLNKLYVALQGDSAGLSPGYTLGRAGAKGLEISKEHHKFTAKGKCDSVTVQMVSWALGHYTILAYKQVLEANAVISSPVSYKFLSPENEAFSLSH